MAAHPPERLVGGAGRVDAAHRRHAGAGQPPQSPLAHRIPSRLYWPRITDRGAACPTAAGAAEPEILAPPAWSRRASARSTTAGAAALRHALGEVLPRTRARRVARC